ncbi:DDE-type integrase/transposase/recombinase [Mesorhizobium sp. M0293]|uniref:DDE-type integrase/transposase/recombinase n=1 Tax=Mesorhizobium sp. M0293 TaxID=2956930 RepID=UPI00333794BD
MAGRQRVIDDDQKLELLRRMEAGETGVNQLWVADITFLHLAEEFAFLAVVLDAFSRKVVGWALDTHLRASLAIEALEMAIADRQPIPGSLIHHSDRGVQGGFKRSSQHSEVGGCDEHSKAAIGTVWTSAITFTRTATFGGAR